MSERKSTLKAKVKGASQEGRLQKWKKHFKSLLRNPPEVTDKPIKKFINSQLNIKQGQFTEKEFDVVLKKIKSEKTASFDKRPLERWKTRKHYI